MRPERDVRLLAAAATFLRQQGYEDGHYRLRLDLDGIKWTLTGGPEWPEEPDVMLRQRGQWLSPLEQRIVDYLSDRGTECTTAERIAAALGEPCQHRFKAIIANLVERQVIDNNVGPGGGYRLLPLPGSTESR